jgi:hypothetical protein
MTAYTFMQNGDVTKTRHITVLPVKFALKKPLRMINIKLLYILLHMFGVSDEINDDDVAHRRLLSAAPPPARTASSTTATHVAVFCLPNLAKLQ